MRRKVTAAALSAGLLVLVPGARTTTSAAGHVGPRTVVAGDVPADLPIPPEDPATVVPADTGGEGGVWTARFASRPVHPASLSAAVLAAYERAVAIAPPECHLSVSLLAAIGQVESGNLAGHRLDAHNRVVPAILGPVLDGRRFQAVADTDAGRWDGNPTWDRALGPLQFIPSTWRVVAVDFDGDGVRDPQDLYDAAGAAMVYLCAGGRNLATDDGLRAAIWSYNHSDRYVDLVLAWKQAYDNGDLSAGGPAAPYAAWSAILAGPGDPGSSVAPVIHHAATKPAHHRPAAPAPLVTAAPPVTVSDAAPSPVPDPAPAEPPATDPPAAGEPTPAGPPGSVTDPCTDPTASVPPSDPDPTTVPDPAPGPAPDPGAPTATDPGPGASPVGDPTPGVCPPGDPADPTSDAPPPTTPPVTDPVTDPATPSAG